MKFAGNIDKLGILGLVVIVLFSPCCFPLFMFAAATLGLGSFELFRGWTMWLFQAVVIITLAGLFISYRKHRCTYPLLIAIPAAALIFCGYYFGSGLPDILFIRRYVRALGSHRRKLLSWQITGLLQGLPSERERKQALFNSNLPQLRA